MADSQINGSANPLGKERAKIKPPAWMTEEEVLELGIEHVAEETPSAVETAPLAEAVVPAPEPEKNEEPVVKPQPLPPLQGSEALLGAPAISLDDESDDFLAHSLPEPKNEAPQLPPVGASPAPAVSATDVSDAALGLSQFASSFTEPTNQPTKTSQLANSEIGDRMQSEGKVLCEIVEGVESLAYLKARLGRICKDGCDPHDMVGLYRIVSQVLMDNLLKQTETLHKMRADYDKRLRQLQEEMLFGQSTELVKSVVRGEAPRKAASAPSHQSDSDNEASNGSGPADSPVASMWRKQIEIKDDLLMKATRERDEAQARCDKMAEDVKNIKARLEKDLTLKSQKAKESLFKKLLPVLDSFDGALKSSCESTQAGAVLDGLRNIYHQLMASCESEGLQSIATEGTLFDPNIHEAMGNVPTNKVPEDGIYDELRRGYMLDDKLLRASMVRLAVPDPDAPNETPPETAVEVASE